MNLGRVFQRRLIHSRPLSDLKKLDSAHVIHPYASLTASSNPIIVERAEGAYYHLSDGRKVIDGMASWWAAIDGYNHPILNNAIKEQLSNMSHVMFGGISHGPAIDLCEKLVKLTPSSLQKVFLCDSGSVSVEVSLKLALQYWYNVTKTSKKSRFLTIRNGYHGDTFGAMSVCDPLNGMHSMFNDILPKHYFVDSPSSESQNPDLRKESHSLQQIEDCLKENKDEIAAIILEPLVQGAGGMKFYSFDFLKKVRELCDKFDILLIFDEIATGFGRTGNLFACMNNDNDIVEPDILCLGKALSAGYLTSGATMMNLKVCEGISGQPYKNSGSFMHGPTFMGNPLTAALCNASIDLLLDSDWKKAVDMIENIFLQQLLPLKDIYPSIISNIRVKGAIGVVQLQKPLTEYISQEKAQNILIDNGVWLRPFGKLLYSMPTFNSGITEHEISKICSTISTLLDEISKLEA